MRHLTRRVSFILVVASIVTWAAPSYAMHQVETAEGSQRPGLESKLLSDPATSSHPSGLEEFLQESSAQILENFRSSGPVASLGQLFPKLIEEANERKISEAVPQALLAAFRSLQTDSEKRHLTGSLGQAMMIGLHEFSEDFEPDPYPRVLPGRKTIWTVTTSPTIDIDAKKKLANWADRKGVLVDPGGGGINIAIALARRGVLARPVFFYVGETGKLLNRLIENRGVVVHEGDAIELKGNEQTRVTIIISPDKAESLVPRGTPVDEEARHRMEVRLLDLQEGVQAGDIVAISGSLAPGLPDSFYADLGRKLVGRGAIVLTDTKGVPAKAVLYSRPAATTIYSQNHLEFGELVGVDPKDRKTLIAKAKEIIESQPPDQGMREIVITEGAGGAFSVTHEKVLEIPAPRVEVASELGAGDTSLAERVFRAWQGKDHDAGFVYGVAAGTASVLHPGTGGGLQGEVDHFAEELGLTEETKVKPLQPGIGLEEMRFDDFVQWVNTKFQERRGYQFLDALFRRTREGPSWRGAFVRWAKNRAAWRILPEWKRQNMIEAAVKVWAYPPGSGRPPAEELWPIFDRESDEGSGNGVGFRTTALDGLAYLAYTPERQRRVLQKAQGLIAGERLEEEPVSQLAWALGTIASPQAVALLHRLIKEHGYTPPITNVHAGDLDSHDGRVLAFDWQREGPLKGHWELSSVHGFSGRRALRDDVRRRLEDGMMEHPAVLKELRAHPTAWLALARTRSPRHGIYRAVHGGLARTKADQPVGLEEWQDNERYIKDIIRDLGILRSERELRGEFIAKIRFERVLERLAGRPPGKLVIVTGMTPTPAGEGKTTTEIGLLDALRRLGVAAIAAIREPSLGPVFGKKGPATGTGMASLFPAERINLSFAGDFPAITDAHNFLTTALYNMFDQGDWPMEWVEGVVWPFTIDLNARQLRDIKIKVGPAKLQREVEQHFVLTAASEIMAVFALAKDRQDLRKRLSNIVVAWKPDGTPLYARDIPTAVDNMMRMLRYAINPNLVQTREGNPVLVHAGPFANIAHGTSSVIATRLAQALVGPEGVVLQETGFGSDLGFEKFIDVAGRQAGLSPDAAVLVVSARALKWHGGVETREELTKPNVEALRRGLPNMDAHVARIRGFGVPVVVAINRFPADTDEEIEAVLQHLSSQGVPAAVFHSVTKGGAGALDLAQMLMRSLQSEKAAVQPLYDPRQPMEEKLAALAQFYGASGVSMKEEAATAIERLQAQYGHLPLIGVKTPDSLSDNAKKRGVPTGWKMKVSDVSVSAGAGFLRVDVGEKPPLLMPGLGEEARLLTPELFGPDEEEVLARLAGFGGRILVVTPDPHLRRALAVENGVFADDLTQLDGRLGKLYGAVVVADGQQIDAAAAYSMRDSLEGQGIPAAIYFTEFDPDYRSFPLVLSDLRKAIGLHPSGLEETLKTLRRLQASNVQRWQVHIFDPENADLGRVVAAIQGDPVVIIARDEEHQRRLMNSGFVGEDRIILRLDLADNDIQKARAEAAFLYRDLFDPQYYTADSRRNLLGWLALIREKYNVPNSVLSLERAQRLVEELEALRAA